VADVLAWRSDVPNPGCSPCLPEVEEAFAAIEAAPGPAAKGAVFAALLERCDALTAKYVAKILTGSCASACGRDCWRRPSQKRSSGLKRPWEWP